MESLTIVATSKENTDFAFVTLTRDDLASGLKDRKCRRIIGDFPNDHSLKLHAANFQESRKA